MDKYIVLYDHDYYLLQRVDKRVDTSTDYYYKKIARFTDSLFAEIIRDKLNKIDKIEAATDAIV